MPEVDVDIHGVEDVSLLEELLEFLLGVRAKLWIVPLLLKQARLPDLKLPNLLQVSFQLLQMHTFLRSRH